MVNKGSEYYYDIAPSSKGFHGRETLTYKSESPLTNGQVVKITLRKQTGLGVVLRSTTRPTFAARLIDNVIGGVILPDSHVSLLLWMQEYYPGPLGGLTQGFVPQLLSKISTTEPLPHDEQATAKQSKKLPPLTGEQKTVVEAIDFDDPKTHIIHGETGSGKTRVYLELAQKTIRSGKSVIVLTPEISLTTPLKKQFEDLFGKEKVFCTHSNLTESERKHIWTQLLKSSKASVTIGPRSALFLPLQNIGLIIIDECHDQAYKQESAPYYHALRVASKLSSITKATLVLGSATPSVSDYFVAQQKKLPILRMQKLAIKNLHKSPPPIIVDLADKSERSNHALLSNSLIREIKECLSKGHQALLFLNRRGSARTIICQDCGWRSSCPRCDVPLTYHGDSHTVACHTCGYKASAPTSCEQCGSSQILFKNPGTKAIEESLKKIFPGVTVGRYDKDNKKHERIEQNYKNIQSGEVDILVGTQLLSKGHDLPRLGLVAMLASDSGLDFPDYTSEERSYQLIRQLSGRVNRGHVEGKLIFQAYKVDNTVLLQALSGDWGSFYKTQLNNREKLGFPPFVYAMKIEVSKTKPEKSEQSMEQLAKTLRDNRRINVIGPTPCFIEKRNGKHHWQLIVTSKSRKILVEIAENIPSGYKIELDPLNFL